MPTFNHPSGDNGSKKGADEDEVDSLHFSIHSNHLFDFYVADELHEFTVVVYEEDVKVVNPLLFQFLKKNPSHGSKMLMAVYSQSKVPNEKVQNTVSIKDLPLYVVQTEHFKKSEKILASHLLLSLIHIGRPMKEMLLLFKSALFKRL